MTDTVTVQLKKPIEHDGKTYSSLTFREATLGDMIAGDAVKGDLNKTAAILASIADVSLPLMRKLAIGDMKAVIAATDGLLGNDDTPKDAG